MQRITDHRIQMEGKSGGRKTIVGSDAGYENRRVT